MFAGTAFAQGQGCSAEEEQRNMEVVAQFPSADVVSESYIQHNPAFKKYADERGLSYREGFLQRMTELMAGGGGGPAADADMPAPPENNPYELVIAEGDLVTVIQKRYAQDPNEAPGTYYETFWFDTFRVRDGLLYEHWDGATIQPAQN